MLWVACVSSLDLNSNIPTWSFVLIPATTGGDARSDSQDGGVDVSRACGHVHASCSSFTSCVRTQRVSRRLSPHGFHRGWTHVCFTESVFVARTISNTFSTGHHTSTRDEILNHMTPLCATMRNFIHFIHTPTHTHTRLSHFHVPTMDDPSLPSHHTCNRLRERFTSSTTRPRPLWQDHQRKSRNPC